MIHNKFEIRKYTQNKGVSNNDKKYSAKTAGLIC